MVTILVIGKGLGDQLARCMAAERVKALGIEDVGKVGRYKRARAVVFDASMLPLDHETFRTLREQAKVSLLAIVSTHEEARLALQLGCDEAVVRPFDLEELKLRGHKMLGLVEGDRLLVGQLLIDLRARRVWRRGEKLDLTRLEFDLLAYLARNAGRVVGYDELLEKVWGYGWDTGGYEAVRSCVKRLRRKIEDDPSQPRYFVTIRGVGYRWEEPPQVMPIRR